MSDGNWPESETNQDTYEGQYFVVANTVRITASGHLLHPQGQSDEELRAAVRACLRELGPEREAVAHAADLERGDGRCLPSHAESLEGLLPEEGNGE